MNENLVTFLFVLLRDKITCGDLEEIMHSQVELCEGIDVIYTNKYLESYARDIAKRLYNGVGPVQVEKNRIRQGPGVVSTIVKI